MGILPVMFDKTVRCGGAGLTEQMRADRKIMMNVSQHISLDPGTRIRRLIALRQQIEQ